MSSSSFVPLPGRRPEEEIVGHLRAGGSALVALSGGVDSALVTAWAREALGPSSVAVTLAGPAVARSEVERATRVAAAIGIRHEVIEVDPIERAEYRANPSNRCYFCRSVETAVLRDRGAALGVRQYLDGVQTDDLGDDRPGIRAMDEAGFIHPLVWAGWGKTAVREAARRRSLPNWDQPSDACLASRVAHGVPISAELLARVESAEAFLLARGYRRVRVRVSGTSARVEVGPDEVARAVRPSESGPILSHLRTLGFESVSVDPRGYHGAAVPAERTP